ncbi:SDR family NAD(P)-dependent oxidoreductase [Pararhizobium arenae]|uniref:SDR family NAD(P)-dependent oxidoreductase n=1 Tax=Pararhizobium arenae TaxID=1856850 RepID=UPI00094ACFAB|nr:SDR family oxidoreductase [Pararhizobium arenae]
MFDTVSAKALVTGGVRGIGAATCLELARQGFDIAVLDVRIDDEAEALGREIVEMGRKASLVTVDLRSVDQCKAAVRQAAEELGGLSVVVNSAGGGFGVKAPFEEVSEAEFDLIMDVNLKGTFFVSQAAVPFLRQSGDGLIVNIASDAAYIGLPMNSVYSASKGAVVTLTKAMARALAPHIRVNTVSPGPTATERFKREGWANDEEVKRMPLGRFAEPSDVALSIAFLAGPGGRHYTGQTLDPNGGVAMR